MKKTLLACAMCLAALPALSDTKIIDECGWAVNADPYTGDKEQAVDELTHIPLTVRQQLKAKMAKHEYDDLINIYRDRIEGANGIYGTDITNMRSGTDKVCRVVHRDKWTKSEVHTALVYRVDEWTIIDPSDCRNIAEVASMPRIDVPPEDEYHHYSPPGRVPVNKLPEPSTLYLLLAAFIAMVLLDRRL